MVSYHQLLYAKLFFPEILCLILAVKYQRRLVQDVTPKPGKYPLSCLHKHNKRILVQDVTSVPGKYPLSCLYKHINKRILVQDVTSVPGKYPLSCLYKHNKMAEFNKLKLALP